MKLIIDINDNEYMGIKEYPNNITSYPVTIHIYDAIRKGVPLEQELSYNSVKTELEDCVKRSSIRSSITEILNKMDRYVADELTLCGTERKFPQNEVFIVDDVYEEIVEQLLSVQQEPCEDKEYEKDLNELKDRIFKEGNTLISKQDLLERFIEIDNEYKNSHWNLLQILTNIDILIGKEPCEDAVSRQAVLDLIANYDLSMGQVIKGIHVLPPVNPQKIGHWIDMGSGQECSECREIQYGYDSFRYFCANCGAKMEGGTE